MWDVYFNVSDIFKNVCEKNNQVSKLFFTKFALCYNEANQNSWDDALEHTSIISGSLKHTETPREDGSDEKTQNKRQSNQFDKKNKHSSPVVGKAQDDNDIYSDEDSDSEEEDGRQNGAKHGTALTFDKNLGIVRNGGQQTEINAVFHFLFDHLSRNLEEIYSDSYLVGSRPIFCGNSYLWI